MKIINHVETGDLLETFNLNEGIPLVIKKKQDPESPVPALKHLIKNFLIYKNVCASTENVVEINNLLFTGDFLNEAKEIVNVYEPLWNLIEGSKKKSLVWSIEEILKLEIPAVFGTQYETFMNNALTPVGLLAYALTPQSKETGLLQKSHDILLRKPIFKGFDKTATTKFMAYHRNAPPFCERHDLDALTYWEFFKAEEHKGLANIALKLCNLPSSSYSGPWMLGHDYSDEYEIKDKLVTILIDSN